MKKYQTSLAVSRVEPLAFGASSSDADDGSSVLGRLALGASPVWLRVFLAGDSAVVTGGSGCLRLGVRDRVLVGELRSIALSRFRPDARFGVAGVGSFACRVAEERGEEEGVLVGFEDGTLGIAKAVGLRERRMGGCEGRLKRSLLDHGWSQPYEEGFLRVVGDLLMSNMLLTLIGADWGMMRRGWETGF